MFYSYSHGLGYYKHLGTQPLETLSTIFDRGYLRCNEVDDFFTQAQRRIGKALAKFGFNPRL